MPGGVTGKKAAKPMTPVRDCVSTFVSVASLDIFTSCQFAVLFWATKKTRCFKKDLETPKAIFVVTNLFTIYSVDWVGNDHDSGRNRSIHNDHHMLHSHGCSVAMMVVLCCRNDTNTAISVHAKNDASEEKGLPVSDTEVEIEINQSPS